MTAAERFARLPTAAKLLLILTAVLLPIGIALVWLGENGIRQSNQALKGRAEDQSRAAAQGMQSLIARDALALRIAANGALASGANDACARAQRSLTIAPGVLQSFELESPDGDPLCSSGTVGETGKLPLAPPGVIAVRIAPTLDAVAVRVGVIGGMATALVPLGELRTSALEAPGDVDSIVLHEGSSELRVLAPQAATDVPMRFSEWPIGSRVLSARIGAVDKRITTYDRLVLLLPFLMWIAAALIAWLLVNRLLIRPLKRLERAVTSYVPGGSLDLPRKVGPAQEIQELRDAFARAVARVEASDAEMAGALEGQAAGSRGPPSRQEQPAGGRLPAQHPRSKRRRSGSAVGLCRDQPAGRRALSRPPQPFCRDGGESRHRAAAADHRTGRGIARRRPGRRAEIQDRP